MDTAVIEKVDENIWVANGNKVRFMGMRLGTRMTIVRLQHGGLWLHSPIARTAEVASLVSALGPVAAIVAPNRFHHLHVGAWAAAHPGARVYAAPGLAEKRRDLRIDETLGSEPPAAWAGQIDQVMFPVAPVFQEIVFFHRDSRSAILTDLIVNERLDTQSTMGKVICKLDGTAWPNGTTPLIARIALRDRPAARRALDTILAWDPESAILAHGDWLRVGAADEIRRRMAWLRGSKSTANS